jgi:hypothetical protein
MGNFYMKNATFRLGDLESQAFSKIISQGTEYGPAIDAGISRFHLGQKKRLDMIYSDGFNFNGSE